MYQGACRSMVNNVILLGNKALIYTISVRIVVFSTLNTGSTNLGKSIFSLRFVHEQH